MGKNLLLLTLSILLVALVAQQPFTEYTEQEQVPLEANIINLGYSLDQKHLVIVTGDGANKFYIREGLRMNEKVTVTIADDRPKLNLATHAFSPDNSLLVVGTKEGSVYGFTIQDNKVQTAKYKFKKNLQTETSQFGIKSISISQGKKIALAAGDKFVVLQIPTDQSTQFKVLVDHLYIKNVTSVAWKYKDENLVLVGGIGATGFFDLFNIANNKPETINTDSTSSIAVFTNGQVLQGRLNNDIMIHEWDETDKKYTEVRPIDQTNNAKQIIVDSKGQYFGAVIELNTFSFVKAWRLDSKIEVINLHNTKTQLYAETPFMNVAGQHFALSGNGNQLILVSNATNMAARWALCKDGTYYEDDKCPSCAGDCEKCFDGDNCLACSPGWYTTDDNKCVACSTVTAGCKTCLDKDTCQECNKDDHWKEPVVQNACECELKYFKDGSKCTLCKDKLDFCQLCSDVDHCTQCYDDGHINPFPNPEDDHCVCVEEWFFDKDKVCQDCKVAINGCRICDNADTCTQCDDVNNFQPNGKGQCQCIEGYWLNPTNKLCQPCSTSIAGCALCQQDGKCISCAQQKRDPNNKCQCQPHTYEDEDLLCKDCDPYRQCLQCSRDKLPACDKCDTAQNRTQEPKEGICLCRKSFVQNDETHLCVGCTVTGCQDCNRTDQCQKCLTQKHFRQKPVDNVCVCQEHRHLTDNKSECWTCDQALTGCSSCQNLKECQQCDDSKHFELNGDTKKCQCKTTFFQQGKDCKLCAEQFDFCTKCNSDKCEQCHDGFSYNEQKNECYCPDDKDFDKDGGRCEDKAGLSALAIIAIIVGILALAGGAVALIKCFKKRQSPLEDGEYEALEENKDK